MTGETGLQKRGKFWHVRVSVNGKKIWRTTGKTDKKEAIKEARDIRRDLRNTPSGSRRQIRSDPERLDATLEEVIEMADAHAGTHGTFKTRGNSESSGSLYKGKNRLRAIARELGVTTVEELRKKIPAYRSNPPAHLKYLTVMSYLSNAAALFSKDRLAYYQEKGFALRNPFEVIRIDRCFVSHFRLPTLGDGHQILEDARRDLLETEPMAYRIVLLAVGIGLRAQEATHVHWADIYEGKMEVRNDSISEWRPKTYQMRSVPIPDRIRFELLSLRQPGEMDSDYIIRSERPEPINGVTRQGRLLKGVAAWLRARGEPYASSNQPVHLLRKFFGSLVARELGLAAAKKYLGHTTILTTERNYVRVLEEPAITFWDRKAQ